MSPLMKSASQNFYIFLYSREQNLTIFLVLALAFNAGKDDREDRCFLNKSKIS